ncbi:hypothetical protein [Piscinibacter sp.]
MMASSRWNQLPRADGVAMAAGGAICAAARLPNVKPNNAKTRPCD